MKNKILSKLLLDWYNKNGRDLPWRVKGGAHPNPYVVLVSEIMLQQTTVKTVIPYFDRFMARFPTVESLAAASLNDVYLYWQGLGYYSRARCLHASAQIIVNQFGGIFPKDRQSASQLKGLGNYTLASYLALAFNQPETVVDGNVIRIISRIEHFTQPVEEVMDIIRKRAQELSDKTHAADYASAIMDLGAMICTPKNPQCLLCPWQGICCSKGSPDIEKVPMRVKVSKKEINGYVYIIRNEKGDFYIRKRAEKGLLSGLFEFPWGEEIFYENAHDTGLAVTHIFTHIKLTLKIMISENSSFVTDGVFVNEHNLNEYPMSTLMKKVFHKFLSIQNAKNL